MTKAKSNALEALRALIAERQQYEQWISTLESKRDGTPQHVFDKVHGDYNTRLQRVVSDIRGHAEELQLSISTLSSRLVEVAREEDTRRDALEEAKLRAEVGEYEPEKWEQLRTEAETGLERIAADRASLDAELGELRSIQKLSEVGSIGDVEAVAAAAPIPVESSSTATVVGESSPSAGEPLLEAIAEQVNSAPSDQPFSAPVMPTDPVEPIAAAPISDMPQPEQLAAASPIPVAPISASVVAQQRPRTGKTPPFGALAARPQPPEPRVDQSKTLKCPECGTPNYPTEWYCDRCGGELATM